MVDKIVEHLERKPIVGISTSILGGIIGKADTTYDLILNVVSNASVFVGFIAGILTLLIQGRKVYNMYFKKEIEEEKDA